jgi:hypothetical protein
VRQIHCDQESHPVSGTGELESSILGEVREEGRKERREGKEGREEF